MFKLTKKPINNIILYKYFIYNKLDDYIIILILSYLGIWYNIDKDKDKDIYFYEDIIYIKYLSLCKYHKQLLNELYNIIKYDDIFHRYEKPPISIYNLYLNFNKDKNKIYISYLKKYLLLSNKIKIDICKKCGNFNSNTNISINALCYCTKKDLNIFLNNNSNYLFNRFI
jgi:hypothetical protein